MGEDTTRESPLNSLTVTLTRFDALDSKVNSFELNLTTVDEKVDRRLMETRPIWELVLSRLDSVDTRFDSPDTKVGSLDTKVRLLILRMQTRQEQLTERVERIENPPLA